MGSNWGGRSWESRVSACHLSSTPTQPNRNGHNWWVAVRHPAPKYGSLRAVGQLGIWSFWQNEMFTKSRRIAAFGKGGWFWSHAKLECLEGRNRKFCINVCRSRWVVYKGGCALSGRSAKNLFKKTEQWRKKEEVAMEERQHTHNKL